MKSVLETIMNPSGAWLNGVVSQMFHLTAVLYRKRQQLLKAFESFPGPPSHWLYGHSSQISQDGELNQLLSWAKKYPYAYPRWFGGFMVSLTINHPDYAKTVFGHGDPKALTVYKFFIPWIGKGLLILHGPKWFQHRRLLTPGFHYDVLKPYVSLMAESTKVMLDKWERLITVDKSVELFEHVSLMTLDSIMKCAFSCHSNCQTDRSVPGVSNPNKKVLVSQIHSSLI
uniref:Uncharacterized protein n=1 Tax=Chelonoidis abingdonii TaxID=106734 RepID=A0A8C0GUF2_CHEAB